MWDYVRRHSVGLLALIVALGGTAYAAGLPRNSVGTKQLRRGAVTSVKVRDHSLRRRDFARGQLRRGATGPSDAFAVRVAHVAKTGDLPGVWPVVAQVALSKPGSYVIDAQLRVTDGRECWLAAGSRLTSPPQQTLDLDPNSPGTGVQRIHLASATTIAEREPVGVVCHSGWQSIDDITLTALRVGALHGSAG